jgi:hypothetical protein
MKRLDTGEFVADDEVIQENKRRYALVEKVMDNMKYNCLDDQIAGFGYGIYGWELHFYGDAVKAAIEIANEIIGKKVDVIFEKVKFIEQWRERPVIGGIEVCTERAQYKCATIGWIANKRDTLTRGIITVEHAVSVNGWVSNDTCSTSDRIAITQCAYNGSFVDASYSPFNAGIDGSPSIKNLGSVVGWFGFDSVSEGMNVSFNGYGSGGRVNTQVIATGIWGQKHQQIVINPVTTSGDSGAAYAHYYSDMGGWILVGLHRIREELEDGTLLRSIGSSAQYVNEATYTYPHLA